MIKNIIAPLQKVLLQKSLCPGCTRQLDKAKVTISRLGGTELVFCECSRVYIYDRDLQIYRRALQSEL